MKFVVKWEVHINGGFYTSSSYSEQSFNVYEEAKRFKEKLIFNAKELGATFSKLPIIEIKD